MKSDEFFKMKASYFLKRRIDIAFIDGLHTFEASLKDTLNTLRILNPAGTIVLHDCLPPHEAAAASANSYEDAYNKRDEKWTSEWCGDVWKTIVYLKHKYPNSLEIFTVEKDYGLGVIKLINKNLDLEIDRELFKEIEIKDYNYLSSDSKNILNLKKFDFLT